MSKGRRTTFVDPVIVSLYNHELEERTGVVRQDLVDH